MQVSPFCLRGKMERKGRENLTEVSHEGVRRLALFGEQSTLVVEILFPTGVDMLHFSNEIVGLF
jgi:hypothetical protein